MIGVRSFCVLCTLSFFLRQKHVVLTNNESMKMIYLIFIICLFSVSLAAPPSPAIDIIVQEEIMPYEALWNAHCQVESNFDANAIGDLTYKEYSYGIVQIRRSRLLDYYLQTGIWYDVEDMFDVIASKEVWMYYACKHKPWELERISREWNGGPRGMRKKSTIKYYHKISSAL